MSHSPYGLPREDKAAHVIHLLQKPPDSIRCCKVEKSEKI